VRFLQTRTLSPNEIENGPRSRLFRICVVSQICNAISLRKSDYADAFHLTALSKIGARIRLLRDQLTKLDGIAAIYEVWRDQNDVPANETVEAIPGCDSASFEPAEVNGCSY
jgi:hypothetical protein